MLKCHGQTKIHGNGANRTPKISVIVPVRNEEQCIRGTLLQVLNQDYDAGRVEVIVADGRSTDQTREIVREIQREHANVTLVDNPRKWSSAGRNAALEVASGDYILLIDGHCDLNNSGYLNAVVDAFARSGADCLGRPQPLNVTDANGAQLAIGLARDSFLGHHPASFIYSNSEAYVKPQSVAVAYRRPVFDAVGTFDERFDACEDVELNHRLDKAGFVCFFSPKVAVSYHPRASIKGLFRQMMRYGRGRMRLARKHPETFSWAGFLPAAFVLGLLVGPVLALVFEWCRPVYFGSLMLYGAAVLLVSVALAIRHRQLKLLPVLPLIFLAIHIGSGSGILGELARPQQPPVPEPSEGITDQFAPEQRAA